MYPRFRGRAGSAPAPYPPRLPGRSAPLVPFAVVPPRGHCKAARSYVRISLRNIEHIKNISKRQNELSRAGLHVSSRLRCACLSTASTCARSTPGNLVRNSSTVAPPSMFSNSAFTGTRVPLKSQTPTTFLGIRSTAGHCDQPIMRVRVVRLVRKRKQRRGSKGGAPYWQGADFGQGGAEQFSEDFSITCRRVLFVLHNFVMYSPGPIHDVPRPIPLQAYITASGR